MKKLLACGMLLLASSAFAAGVSNDQTQNGGAIPVRVVGGGGSPAATIYTGQAKIAVTGTAVQLPVVAGINGFTVRSKQTNTGVGGLDCVGPSGVTTTSDGTGNGDCEPPGSGWAFSVSSSGAIYVNGAAGDVFFVNGN
jgi:hypothetical protein